MPSRRDQLQSHQFLLQRVVSAFVTWETDPVRSPFRRAAGASFAGAMVLALALAGAGVVGLLRPGGGGQWRTDGSVVVEKETGAVYLYRDQEVYPVINYTSARLLGRANTEPVSVGRRALRDVPRGTAIGIPGAPTSLPSVDDLMTGAWVVCSSPGRTTAGAATVSTALTVGGGAPGADAGDDGVLVRTPGSRVVNLLWHGQRHVLAGDTLEALALTQSPEMVVSTALLNTVPRGADLRAPRVRGAGSPSTAMAGVRTGQVVRVRSGAGTEEFYLVERTALRPVTPLEAAILLGSADLARVYDGAPAYVDTSPAGVGGLTAGGGAGQRDVLDTPARLPRLAQPAPGDSLCATFHGGGATPVLTVGGAAPAAASVAPSGTVTAGTDRLDSVLVEPGHAALVEAMTSPDAQDGALTLVTDAGLRFALPEPGVIAALGYAGAPVVRLPAALVSRVPAGPALDPAAASSPAFG